MTRGNVLKQGWVFPLFSPDSDDRLSLNFHRFVILYRSCDTRSVGLGHYCLPKVSNGLNRFCRLELLCVQGYCVVNIQNKTIPQADIVYHSNGGLLKGQTVGGLTVYCIDAFITCYHINQNHSGWR